MRILHSFKCTVRQNSFGNYLKYSWSRGFAFMELMAKQIWYISRLISTPIDILASISVFIQKWEYGSKLLNGTKEEKKIKNTLRKSLIGNRVEQLDVYEMYENKYDLFKVSIDNHALWVNIHQYGQLNSQQKERAITSMGNYMRYYGPAGEIIAPWIAGSFSFWYANKLLKKHYSTGVVGMIRKSRNAQKIAALVGGGVIAFKILKRAVQKSIEIGLAKGPFNFLFNNTVKVCLCTDNDNSKKTLKKEKLLKNK